MYHTILKYLEESNHLINKYNIYSDFIKVHGAPENLDLQKALNPSHKYNLHYHSIIMILCLDLTPMAYPNS